MKPRPPTRYDFADRLTGHSLGHNGMQPMLGVELMVVPSVSGGKLFVSPITERGVRVSAGLAFPLGDVPGLIEALRAAVADCSTPPEGV